MCREIGISQKNNNMKTFKLFMLLACMCMLSYTAMSQYTFTIKFSITGRCFDGLSSNLRHEAESLVNNALAQTGAYPLTKEECEALNRLITSEAMSISSSGGGCNIKWTISRCTGKEPFGGKDIILGPQQGSSFYSTNPANEVADWVNDDIERQFALNKDNLNEKESSEFSKAKNGLRNNDSWFLDDEIHMPLYNHHPLYSFDKIENEIIGELYDKYGININKILWEANRTDVDIANTDKYLDWLKRFLMEENKIKEMAICSALSYSDNPRDVEKKLLENTSFEKVSELSKDDPLYRLFKLIDLCNNDQNNQGFHAELLYSKELNEYTVVFRGTEFPTKYEFINELVQHTSPQEFSYLYLKIPSILINIKEGNYDKIAASLDCCPSASKFFTDLFEGNTQRMSPRLHDLATNLSQNGLGLVLTQYRMAIEIGDVIKQIKENNPDLKFNITGHSMGGGEGIVAGVVSGQPTFVFNPAGVHSNTIEYAGKTNDVEAGNYNIMKISTDDDPLTNIQEKKMLTEYVEMAREVLKRAVKHKTGDDEIANNISEKALPVAIGQKKELKTGEGHSIVGIANHEIKKTQIIEKYISFVSKTKELRIYMSSE